MRPGLLLCFVDFLDLEVVVADATPRSRYWGKRDTRLILPTNSSLSITLSQDHLRSTTTSRADPRFHPGDRLWLNGKEEVIKENGRTWVCIQELRAWRKAMEEKDKGLPKVSGRAQRASHPHSQLHPCPSIQVYSSFSTVDMPGLCRGLADLAPLGSSPRCPSASPRTTTSPPPPA